MCRRPPQPGPSGPWCLELRTRDACRPCPRCASCTHRHRNNAGERLEAMSVRRGQQQAGHATACQTAWSRKQNEAHKTESGPRKGRLTRSRASCPRCPPRAASATRRPRPPWLLTHNRKATRSPSSHKIEGCPAPTEATVLKRHKAWEQPHEWAQCGRETTEVGGRKDAKIDIQATQNTPDRQSHLGRARRAASRRGSARRAACAASRSSRPPGAGSRTAESAARRACE